MTKALVTIAALALALAVGLYVLINGRSASEAQPVGRSDIPAAGDAPTGWRALART